jgi:TRAP-type C4-dicarboxylate transport system substrate-binding protein
MSLPRMTGGRVPGSRTFLLVLAASLLPAKGAVAQEEPIVIKLATLAPSDSEWHEILKDMGEEWSRVSDGRVELRIYPGGVAGQEADVLRKMRIGQLHAGALSVPGLARIVPEVHVLTIPMNVDGPAALERVRRAMEPRLEERFAENGYILLNWGDAGWVRFFLPGPGASPDEVRGLKFPAWSDDAILDLWREEGFRGVTLNISDVLPSLQTGLINALNTTPLVVLSNQWFSEVEYMLDMPWTPLVGATIVDRRAWERIPEELRPELIRIARVAERRLQTEITRLEDWAIAEMEERGLQIIEPSDALVQEWRSFFESHYPKIRGPLIPPDWFDEALRLGRGGA